MRYPITAKLIGHDLSGFTIAGFQNPLEEAFCSVSITLGLKENIDHLGILINCTP
jgi:hypothetical protein